MANSPSHKLGQLIGNFIELGFQRAIEPLCKSRSLYLDVVGSTRKARKGKKVSWKDVYGNKHDLDFVIERNGSHEQLGTPAALIECAWRRYTKHSKNKAQEIQGAIMPIAEKYRFHKPFLGAVIAGEYTKPSIEQLRSCGFGILYFEYNSVVEAFDLHGVNIRTEESTPDEDIEAKIEAFKRLTDDQLCVIFGHIAKNNESKISSFMAQITESLDRQIRSIIVTPLYGKNREFESIDDVYSFLEKYDTEKVENDIEFSQFFIRAVYGNGDEVTGEFSSKQNALQFLRLLSS